MQPLVTTVDGNVVLSNPAAAAYFKSIGMPHVIDTLVILSVFEYEPAPHGIHRAATEIQLVAYFGSRTDRALEQRCSRRPQRTRSDYQKRAMLYQQTSIDRLDH